MSASVLLRIRWADVDDGVLVASSLARAVVPPEGTLRERQAWVNGYDAALVDRGGYVERDPDEGGS